MKATLLRTLLGATVLLGASQQVLAQDVRTEPNTDRTGTAAGMWLLLPVTAQTASLAGTGTATMAKMSGLDAATQNPAGLMLNTGTNAMFSRLQFVEDIGISHFGVAQRFGNNNVSLSVSALGSGTEFVRTVDTPDITDETWTANYIAAGLGFARQFTDRIAAGVTVKAISETMAADLNGRSVAFDAGMSYIVPGQGLRFGVAVRNIGTAMSYDGDGLLFSRASAGGQPIVGAVNAESYELPASLDFGVTYQRPFSPDLSMTLATNFRSVQYANDQYGASLGLNFRNLFYAQGGYQYEPNRETSFFTGANVGAGLNVPFGRSNVKLDYTYTFTRVFDRMQFITASVTF